MDLSVVLLSWHPSVYGSPTGIGSMPFKPTVSIARIIRSVPDVVQEVNHLKAKPVCDIRINQ